MADALFPDLTPPTDPGDADLSAAPRYETPNRQQVELYPCDLESLLPPEHAARLVWRFVDGLDLQRYYDAIRARGARPGRPAIDPKVLVALWLYATIDGVGRARELERLCRSHDAYRWICGGVSVNYHTLSDFRVEHEAALDELLTQSITVLLRGGVITLARVAHDGTKIRASAGVGSFRRGATLRECLRQAARHVRRTKEQAASPGPSRQRAAEQRAAADRLARVTAALAELPAVEAAKARTAGKRTDRPAREARVSTTDPEARLMKRADGGFRPSYNVQLATDGDSRAIVGVAVTNVGSDAAEGVPMLTQIQRRCGRAPDTLLADCGVGTKTTITAGAALGTTVYAPVPRARGATDLTARCAGDSEAVAAWRVRMATDDAHARYRDRGAIAERTNADLHTHRGLDRVVVRGSRKVLCCALWAALALNAMIAMRVVPHLMM